MTDRKPPQEINAEESILVSILLDQEHREKAFDLLNPEDFYSTANRIVFEKCIELGKNCYGIEAADIYSKLSEDERKYVKAEFLYNLIDTVSLAVNIDVYIQKLKDAAFRRRTIELSNAIQKRCFSPNGDNDAIRGLAQQIIDSYGSKANNQIIDALLHFENVVSLKLPEKRVFLDPWITEQSITLISGWRGLGKTWLAMSILDAVSKGTSFGPWNAETPIPSLYVDGEMPIQDMQYRAKQLNMGQDFKQPIYLYSDAYSTGQGLPRANLLNEKWRDQMKTILLDKGIKLWVIDNIASLAPGINENAKEDWDPINEYFLSLRFAGIATILLHHVGKGGFQRGTSAREDNIDTSIILKQPDDYQTEDGCRFIMEFKKNRVVCGDHFLLAENEFQYNDGKWIWQNAKTKNEYAVYKLLDEGISQKEIAEQLDISKGRVSQIKTKGINEGLLDKKGSITPTGWEQINLK